MRSWSGSDTWAHHGWSHPQVEYAADGIGFAPSGTAAELGSPTPDALLARYAADILVYGHTHRALLFRPDGRVVVNPGSAGPSRFNLKPSVAILTVTDGGSIDVRFIEFV